ncbi:major facilitator superfamily protein [Artemisia annua]|uniref:Major facilitator superfamily protein n=1 Tax=Artemisia annua TaxID=35608 RepID=A0A2U1KNI8_ARTAN|nr:major facilitator superfamily protein [Artemisia annua]
MELNDQPKKHVEVVNNSQHKAVEDTNNVLMKHSNRGGWTTFPFILGCMFAIALATGGWVGNLIVYLITKYNVKSIDATQIINVVLGCFFLFPIPGAILADSFYGPFIVVVVFSIVSLVGMTLMTLTAAFPSLRPSPCTNMSLPCESPSKLQYGVLYTILGLTCIGFGGTRFTTATMGADQFKDPNSVATYFNWYYCALYVAGAISSTAIVYVQDNVSWTLGFGISAASNLIGVILFLSGTKFYQRIKPTGSPFTSIARVIVAAVRKRRVSSRNHEFNYDIDDKSNTSPSDSFRFLNRGAIKIESDGQKSKSWSLSSVQEVEDLKTLIRIMPLWSSSVLLSGLVGMFNNFIILQALAMDRHLGGSNFKIPAASFLFFNTLATAISLFIIDRFIFPVWKKLNGSPLTPLQRIGVGHVLNVLGLVLAGIIEVQRLHTARSHNLIGISTGMTSVVPFPALWLVAPLIVVGISEGFLFPGQILLYYQEFPTSLRGTSTAMVSLLVAVGFYLSTGITSLIRKSTAWLMNDLNDGRLDIVYWLLAAIGVVNFGYFLICAKMFQHKLDKYDDNMDNTSSS